MHPRCRRRLSCAVARRVHNEATWRVTLMAEEIRWGTDLDSAVKTAGDKLVLLDFSAAPM